MNDKLALFEDKAIRKIYKNNKWYYSILDIITFVTDSSNPNEYLKRIKQKDKELEKSWNTLCIKLNMQTKDGKIRKVMTSDTIGILRIIQSIPAEKNEKIKMWLAHLGDERIAEINNPEILMDRMKNIYELKGYSRGWIEQREREITTKHSLQDEWEKMGITPLSKEYLILTDEIYKSNFGINITEYQKLKATSQENCLKDSMTNLELAILNLAETTTAEIHQKNVSRNIDELKRDIKEVGDILITTKDNIETKLEKSIINKENYMNLTNYNKN